jgi:hypothetical protein
MPRLLLFAPVQKIILDRDENTLSLIGFIEMLTLPPVSVEAPAPPEDAISPMQWAVSAIWLQTDEDEGKQYEQRVRLIKPNGGMTVDGLTPFRMTHRTLRNNVRVNGFPVTPEGDYTLTLELREADGEWMMITDYPIRLQRAQPEAAEPQPSPAS